MSLTFTVLRSDLPEKKCYSCADARIAGCGPTILGPILRGAEFMIYLHVDHFLHGTCNTCPRSATNMRMESRNGTRNLEHYT